MQWLPDVATAADGRFVVVWQEGGDGRRLTNAGLGEGPALRCGREAARRRDSGRPPQASTLVGHAAVAMAPDGRFVVVWGGGTENPDLVYGRRYAADGRPLGPRFPLARNTDYQDSPDVAMAADGSFVAVWVQGVEPEDPTDLPRSRRRRLLPPLRRRWPAARSRSPRDRRLRGAERAPGRASGPMGASSSPAMTMAARARSTTSRHGSSSRSGAPLGDVFQVNDGPQPEVTQHGPSVAVAADGRFAIAWTDGAATSTRIRASRASRTSPASRSGSTPPTAPPWGRRRSVNVFLRGEQTEAAVSALQTGGFLMLWTSGAGQDGDGFGIFGRVFGADGTPRGREFRINLKRTGSQLRTRPLHRAERQGSHRLDRPRRRQVRDLRPAHRTSRSMKASAAWRRGDRLCHRGEGEARPFRIHSACVVEAVPGEQRGLGGRAARGRA